MKVNAKILKKENASASLEIEVEKENVITEFDKVINSYKKNASLPGFRKGKAPINIIKTKYKEDIYDNVLRNIIPLAYAESLTITKLNPYTQPEVKIINFSENDKLTFEANVQLRPETELGTYKDVTFHQIEYKIDPKDIKAELEKLQERFADLILKDNKPIADNNVVVMEVKAYDENNDLIAELSDENHKIEMNKTNLFEEFYKALINAKIGEEKTLYKKYPENFNNKILANKNVKFDIKIKEVREKKLPDLNDEFAKDVGDYKSLEELENAIQRQLIDIAEKHSEEKLEIEIIDKIVNDSKFEIPEKLIESQTNNMLSEFQYNLSAQGHDVKKLISEKVIDLEKVKLSAKEQAIKDLKSYLILYKIGEKENIKVEDNDVENFIEEEAKKYKKTKEEYKKNLGENSNDLFKQIIIKRKVVDFLKQNNKIKKSKIIKFKELLNELEQKK